MTSQQLVSTTSNWTSVKKTIAERGEASSRKRPDDKLRSFYFESEDDSDSDDNGWGEGYGHTQSSTKRKRQWNCDDALQMARFEFTKHGLMGISDEIDDQVDRGSPLGELYLDTKREVITFFYDFNKRLEGSLVPTTRYRNAQLQVPRKSKFGIIKQCRAALKNAAMSWYGESNQKPQILPPKSHILACRFICDYGELDGVISKFLLAIGRYDLAQIPEHSGNSFRHVIPTDGAAHVNTSSVIAATAGTVGSSGWQTEFSTPKDLVSRGKQGGANQLNNTIEAAQATTRSNNSGYVEQLKVIRGDFTERVGELQRAAEQINSTLKSASRTISTSRRRSQGSHKRAPPSKKLQTIVVKAPKVEPLDSPSNSSKKDKKSFPNFDGLTFDQIDPYHIIDHSSDSDYQP